MPLPSRRPGYRVFYVPGQNPRLHPPPDVYVYAIQCGEYVKVGIAADMVKRMRAFSTDNPYPVKVLTKQVVRADKAPLAERMAHEALETTHHRGEWFTAAPKDAVREVKAAARWAQYVAGPWDEACLDYQDRFNALANADFDYREGTRAELEAMAEGEG